MLVKGAIEHNLLYPVGYKVVPERVERLCGSAIIGQWKTDLNNVKIAFIFEREETGITFMLMKVHTKLEIGHVKENSLGKKFLRFVPDHFL